MKFKSGDKILIGCDDRTVEGKVILASENGVSLMLAFEAILDGCVGTMPVMLEDGVYRNILTGQAIAIAKSRRAQ